MKDARKQIKYFLIGLLLFASLAGWSFWTAGLQESSAKSGKALEQRLRGERFGRWLAEKLHPDSQPAEEFSEEILPAEEALLRSIDLLSDGRQNTAEEVIESAVRYDFDNPDLLFAQAVLERSRWGKDSSRMWFALLARKDRGSDLDRAGRLSLAVDNGKDVEQSLADLALLADEHPDNIYLLWLSAIECREAKNGGLGKRQYEKLLKQFRVGPVMVHHTYANILTEHLAEYEEALPHRYLAVSLSPRSWTYEGLADTLLYLEQYDLSSVMWQNAIELDGTNPRYYDRRGDALYHLQRYDEMMTCYLQADALGSIYAGADIASCYEKGIGMPVDAALAAEWFRHAAELNNAWAQYKLGWCLKRGNGVEQDLTEAAKWFRKSAEQGNSDAQLDLGFCYEKGLGVQEDMEEAVEWYKKAAAQQNAVAICNLGLCYQTGNGVEKNNQKAADFFLEALAVNPRHVRSLNNYAWFLLTCDDPAYHNYPEAVSLAERSVAAEAFGYNLDTLAVAYFKNQQYEKAVETQERLIEFRRQKAPEKEIPERMKKRLEEYKRKRAEL